MTELWPHVSDTDIVSVRSAKNRVDPARPYAFHIEPECTASGAVEDVATLFLTNRECPFRCLMCDLWKNTTDESVAAGQIVSQIEYALSRLPPARHIKLYNSGNFFDRRAIPPDDHAEIANRVRGFSTVIVENHPRFCTDACVEFRERIETQLEIAIGLETAHPDVLARLNKQMTLDDFSRAVEFLGTNGIDVRTFILLRPPFLDERQGIEWALKSIEFAFSAGVGCCAVIPTRGGNGVLEKLQADGLFTPPALSSMETVLDEGIRMNRGRVFMDLWDANMFFDCPDCGFQRVERMRQMNLSQQVQPPIVCQCVRGTGV